MNDWHANFCRKEREKPVVVGRGRRRRKAGGNGHSMRQKNGSSEKAVKLWEKEEGEGRQ